MGKALDLNGKRFGRLTVLERAERGKWGEFCWVCKCDCGEVKTISGKNLISGRTQSCGCYRKEVTAKLAEQSPKGHLIHGMSRSKLYRVFASMKDRCFNERSKSYKNYGGRGIIVCSEWLKFEVFREWALSNGYMEGLTIERIDVNGNYCPENCTWIPLKDQQCNKTTSVKYNSRTQMEWAVVLGVSESGLRNYRKRHNCSLEKAVRYNLLQKFI